MSLAASTASVALGLAVAAQLLVSGCSDDGPVQAPATELGTGLDEFVHLTDGDGVAIVQGPQGGFHIFSSVRVRGLEPGNSKDLRDPENPTTVFRAFVDAARIDLDASTYTQGLDPGPDRETYEMVGRLLILDIVDPATLEGASIRIEVTVTDVAGRTASDVRTVIAHVP